MVSLRLILPGDDNRERIVGGIGEHVLPPVGDDQAVELAVVLQGAAAVDADDLPVPLQDRVGAHGILPVEHHRPVSDDKPAFKAPVRLQQGVDTVEFLRPVFLQRFSGCHPGVREDEALRFQRVRNPAQIIPDFGVLVVKQFPQRTKVRNFQRVDPLLQAHVPQKPAPAELNILQDLVVGGVGEVRHVHIRPVIAVAADHMDVLLFFQLRQQAEQAQALRSLFQEIPVDDQGVPITEAGLLQRAVKIRHIGMDIGHDKDPAVFRQVQLLDPRTPLLHFYPPSIRSISRSFPVAALPSPIT